MSALRLDDFTVSVQTADGPVVLADGITLAVERGETLCVVGESGSGKSVTMLAALRLLDFTSSVSLTGRAEISGVDVVPLGQTAMSAIRGTKVGVVFQEAMEALNPSQRIGDQLEEAYRASDATPRVRNARARLIAAHEKALGLLTEVGIVDPATVMRKYPHQLSGGMQQRVMIAMALMGDPELLIADEPTTALDVTVQAEILDLLRRLQAERGMAIVLITHDMGVAAEIAHRIAVLYAGQVVECGEAQQMLHRPQHPYTKALLECVPRPGERLAGRMRTIPGSVPTPGQRPLGDRFAPRNALATPRCLVEPPPVLLSADGGAHMIRSWAPVEQWTPELIGALTGRVETEPLTRVVREREVHLSLRGVNKTYGAVSRGPFTRSTGGGTRAVIDLDLDIHRGELFGLVGESGSGKSTIGRIMLDLERPDAGSTVSLDGIPHSSRRGHRAQRALRREVQAVFQDPQGSIDPRQSIRDAIAEPLRELTDLDRRGVETRVREMLDAVGLPTTVARKHAAELSGGQRQRVAIARAVAPNPRMIVADEPTSALDVSVQGQIVNLLLELQRDLGLTVVMITHNLSLITAIADRVGVMYRGRLVEVGDAEHVMTAPDHDYTARLLAANLDPFHPRATSVTRITD